MNTFAKRAAAAAMSMVMLFSFSSCGKADEAAPEETASARVTVDGTKFMVDGKLAEKLAAIPAVIRVRIL